MKLELVARSDETGALNISRRIISIEVLHGSDEILGDIEAIIELLKKLKYKVD